MLLREIIRSFKIYFIVGLIFLGLYSFNRMTAAEVYGVVLKGEKQVQSFGEFKFAFLMIFTSSFCLAFFSSLLDVLVLKRLIKNKSLGLALIASFLAQTSMIILIISLMITFSQRILSWGTGREEFSPPELVEVLSILVYLMLVAGTSKFLVEIDHKLGPGNLWKMITGRFLRPHEEERIFMFIDMKNSTTIAEKIGHLEFSKLLQDCFQDFAVVDKYRTDIYQYVGDEVVVSWLPKNGFKKDNFLKSFFAFNNVLDARSEYYKKEYGIMPHFKAGANIGPVIVAEVGDIKREINYHGDTLNTAARIQGMCNELDARMLIPEALYNLVKDTECYDFDDVGSIALKGKKQNIRLFKVTET